jgi:hypothetical protein
MLREYIHKPNTVQAIQFDGTDAQASYIASECPGVKITTHDGKCALLIPQIEYSILIQRGEFIVKHPDGSLEGFKAAYFHQEYSPKHGQLGYWMKQVVLKDGKT